MAEVSLRPQKKPHRERATLLSRSTNREWATLLSMSTNRERATLLSMSTKFVCKTIGVYTSTQQEEYTGVNMHEALAPGRGPYNNLWEYCLTFRTIRVICNYHGMYVDMSCRPSIYMLLYTSPALPLHFLCTPSAFPPHSLRTPSAFLCTSFSPLLHTIISECRTS